MKLKDAVGSFFVEFSKLETHTVGMALRSLSRDPVFVQHAEQLLDLEARLKLLERMAFARNVPPGLVAELEACLLRARMLRDHRDEVARTAISSGSSQPGTTPATVAKARRLGRRNADFTRLAELENLMVPEVTEIEAYATEAVNLQGTLCDITKRIESQFQANAA